MKHCRNRACSRNGGKDTGEKGLNWKYAKRARMRTAKVRDNQPTQFMNPRNMDHVYYIYIFAVLRCGK